MAPAVLVLYAARHIDPRDRLCTLTAHTTGVFVHGGGRHTTTFGDTWRHSATARQMGMMVQYDERLETYGSDLWANA